MSGGVKAALDEVVEAMGEAAREPGDVVGDLLAGLDATETGALDAPSPFSAVIQPRNKGGRPKGARNRRTEAMAQWLLAQARHPVLVMMEAYSMRPAEFAARIGLRHDAREEYEATDKDGKTVTRTRIIEAYSNDTLMEVLKLQMRMAESAAPYVAQKLPQAVQVDAKGGLTVSFEGVNLPARGGPAGVLEPVEGEAMAVALPFKSDE